MRRILITVLAFVPVVLLMLGGMSEWVVFADSLAVFRLPLGILTFLAGASLWGLWPRRIPLMVMALGIAGAVPILVTMRADAPIKKPLFIHYQKNLWFRNADLAPLAADIIARTADFVTLQEVSNQTRPLLGLLQDSYPAQHYCKFATIGGVAVAARFPMIEGSAICSGTDGIAAMQVTTPSGPVWVVSIHLRWPYPHGQATQVAQMLPVLEGLEGPIFLGGDFNMVPWSHTVTQIETATRTHRIGHSNGTFTLSGIFNMPIDHVLAPLQFGGTVTSLPLLGSDHQGVEARIELGG